MWVEVIVCYIIVVFLRHSVGGLVLLTPIFRKLNLTDTATLSCGICELISEDCEFVTTKETKIGKITSIIIVSEPVKLL